MPTFVISGMDFYNIIQCKFIVREFQIDAFL